MHAISLLSKYILTLSIQFLRLFSFVKALHINKRAAVVAKAVEKDYIKKTIPKSEDVRKLIYNAIKPNILFRACSEEELVDLVDAFSMTELKAGATVIKQGDEGEHFYVVENGELDITVRMGKGGNEVQVGVPYVSGSAFGELALMYGSPRAATIRAKNNCILWNIDRQAFRGITGQHKFKRAESDIKFLRNVSFTQSNILIVRPILTIAFLF